MRRRVRRAVKTAGQLLAGALVLGVSLGGGRATGQEWAREYQRGIHSESSDQRRAAIEAIDPASRVAYKLVLASVGNKKASQVDWYQREAVIEKLGEIEDKRSLKKLDKLLKRLTKRSRDPLSTWTLLAGASRTEDPRFEPYFVKCFQEKARHPISVRRVAVAALGRTEKTKYVPDILKVWEGAPLDYRTALTCREALQAITEVDHGLEVARWKAFWEAKGKGYVRPSDRPDDAGSGDDTEARPEEPEAKRITTVTREMSLEFTTTGRDGAMPLLVIHDDTWRPTYFEPYLRCLGDLYKIYYVTLPAITELVRQNKDHPERIKRNIGGFPYYPYDALCDAFDEARKKLGFKKFAILAHGFSTMIAERYLSKYGQNVDHVILVGAFPSDDAYGNVLSKLRAKSAGSHEKELVHAVDYHYITDEKTFTRFYDPADDRELEALERKWFTMMFADPQDPEIGALWEKAKGPINVSLKVAEKEQSQSPPFDVMREKRPPVPVLVISGKKAIWFGESDGERVAKNYPKGRHVVLPNAANMPWFDDPVGFQRAVRDFAKSTGLSPK